MLLLARPREYVIKETLIHSSTIEENLEKLEYGGEICNIKGNTEPISKLYIK